MDRTAGFRRFLSGFLGFTALVAPPCARMPCRRHALPPVRASASVYNIF